MQRLLVRGISETLSSVCTLLINLAIIIDMGEALRRTTRIRIWANTRLADYTIMSHKPRQYYIWPNASVLQSYLTRRRERL